MNENVDARRIAEILNRHGVQYVTIGGYGAELHEVAGLPPTRDVDVCPSTERENLERLSRALTTLHALIRTDAVEGGCHSHTTLSPSHGPTCGTSCAMRASSTSPSSLLAAATST